MKISKNYLYNLSYTLINMLLPLITAPYLSRILGVSGIGTYSFYYAITFYFMIFAKMGLINYGTRLISSVRDNQKELNKTFSSIYSCQFLISLMVIIIYFFYAYYISENSLISMCFFIMIMSTLFDIDWLFNGLEKFKSISIRNIFVKILTVISIFLIVKDKNDIYLYILIMSIGTLIGFLSMWVSLKKEVAFTRVTLQEIYIHFIPNLKLTLPVIAVNIYRSIDKIMLGLLSTTIQCGLYENSEKIIYCICGFISSYGTVMLPRISNSIKNNNFFNLEKITSNSLFFLMNIILPFIIILNLLSKEIIEFLFGAEFLEAQILLIVLSMTIIFITWTNVIRTHIILPLCKDNIYIISVSIGAIIDIIVNLLLIRKYGALGAVIGTIFAEFSVPLIQTLCIKNQYNCGKFIRVCVPSWIISILTFFIIYILKLNMPVNSLILYILLWSILTFFIYYFILFVYLFFFKKEWLYKVLDRLSLIKMKK